MVLPIPQYFLKSYSLEFLPKECTYCQSPLLSRNEKSQPESRQELKKVKTYLPPFFPSGNII